MAATHHSAHRVALILVALSLVLFGCSDDPGTTPNPSTTAVTTTPPPSPEDLAGEAAVTALTQFVEVTNAAQQDPTARDWEPEIRQYAGDPHAFLTVQSIREYVTLGIRQEGEASVEAEVRSVDLAALEGPTVLITACYDVSESELVRADTGESIRPPGAPAELDRFVWEVTVIQYVSQPGEPWLVSILDAFPDEPC